VALSFNLLYLKDFIALATGIFNGLPLGGPTVLLHGVFAMG